MEKRSRNEDEKLSTEPGQLQHPLGGERPLHTRQGEMLAEQQRRHREVGSGGSCEQSAGLTNRKRIEAAHWGNVAKSTDAQCLHGTMRRISDGHLQRVTCITLGELLTCLTATDIARCRDGCAAVSRGRSRRARPARRRAKLGSERKVTRALRSGLTVNRLDRRPTTAAERTVSDLPCSMGSTGLRATR